jgi:hypothetical protein
MNLNDCKGSSFRLSDGTSYDDVYVIAKVSAKITSNVASYV